MPPVENHARAASDLKVVGKRMSRYAKRTAGKFGRAAVPDAALRASLIADARAVRSLARALRRDLTCP